MNFSNEYILNSTVLQAFLRFFGIMGSFFLLSLPSSAEVIVNDSKKEFILASEHITYVEDSTGKCSVQQILAHPKWFKPIQSLSHNENRRSAYWLKFDVKLNSTRDYNYLLESYAPHTDEIQLFILTKQGKIKTKQAGQGLAFYNREYLNKNLIFDLPLRKGEVQTFYLRIKSQTKSEFDYRIKSINYFSYYSTNEYFLLGLYYGVLLVMALYNFIMFFYLKEKVYLFYVGYVICAILSTLTDDGLGYQYVWFDHPALNPILGYYVAPIFLLVSFVWYAHEFLNLSQYAPKLGRIIRIVLFTYLGYYTIGFFLPEGLQFRGSYVFPYLAVYIVAWHQLFHGNSSARFFLIGNTIIFLSIIILQLRALGWVEGNLFTVYVLNYGLVLEVIALSIAMADRFRWIKTEKDKAADLLVSHRALNSNLQEMVESQLKENLTLQEKHIQELEAKNKETQAFVDMFIQILNEIPLKVFLKKYNGEFFVVNEAVAKFHQLRIDQMIGKSDKDFYDEKDAEEWLKAEHEIIHNGKQEYQNEDNGRLLNTVKMPFYINPIQETGLLGYQQDITDYIKEREKTQKEIIRQLEENNKLQEEINKQLEANNQLQEKVNRELEQKVAERTTEVMHQKEELEKQSERIEYLYKELTDSIETAKIIQESILPSPSAFKMFLPEIFILFKPKDIVSGDFYWLYVKNNKIIVAAVDCTGHGVAGAFMSLIGYNLLNQIIKTNAQVSASDILNKLNEGVISSLHQDEAGSMSREGMDIALAIIDPLSKTIQFSGANNPLYLIRDTELTIYKADKYSIGIQRGGKTASFTHVDISYKKGDQIYLFSDGYAGQLGGEDGMQKYMLPRFRETLLQHRTLPMHEQQTAIDQDFESWKNGQEQLDDVLVIGIRL